MGSHQTHSPKVARSRWDTTSFRWGVCRLLLVGVGLGLAVIYTRGLVPVFGIDENHYISSAKLIAQGLGAKIHQIDLDDRSLTPLIVFPPGFPAVMAVPVLLGVPAHYAPAVVNLTAYAVVMVLTGRVARVAFGPVVACFAIGLLAISYQAWLGGTRAWAEMLLMALVLGVVVLLTRRSSAPFIRFIVVGSFVAAAFYTRYVGAVLGIALATGTVAIRPLDIARFLKTCLCVTVGFALMVPWLARNWHLSESLMGERGSSARSLGLNVVDAGWAFVEGFLPQAGRTLVADYGSIWAEHAVGSGVTLTVLGVLLWDCCRRRRWDKEGDRAHGLLAWITLVFLVSVIVARTVVDFSDLDARLMLPVLPYLCVTIARVLANALKGHHTLEVAAVTTVVLMLTVAGIHTYLGYSVEGRYDVRRAAEWVNENVDGQGCVFDGAGRSSLWPYLSQARVAPLATTSPALVDGSESKAALSRRVEALGCRYVVVYPHFANRSMGSADFSDVPNTHGDYINRVSLGEMDEFAKIILKEPRLVVIELTPR